MVARAVLEKRAGRTLNDLEWDQEHRRPLAFLSILRDWGQKQAANAATLLNAA